MAGTAITAFLPFVTSGSIFAPRRVNKGLGSNNAIVSIMDYDIAVGQGAKVLEGAANIAKESKNSSLVANVIEKEKALEEFLKADKTMATVGKVTRFTMNHINPLIGATETIKVLYADNKEEAALTGGMAFGGMIAGETAAKNFLGLAKTKYRNGKYEVTPREALYKKLPFYKEESAKAIKDLCETTTFFGKHMFKHAPKIVKGSIFAGASIGTFAVGDITGQAIYDNFFKNNSKKADTVNTKRQNNDIKPENTENKTYSEAA